MHAHTVLATRISGGLGEAHAREVLLPIETAPAAATAAGHGDALSPVELLLAAVAGGVLCGVEQAAAALCFQLANASVEVCGVFAGHATTGLAVEYDLSIETGESDSRLVQFHELVRHADALLHLGPVGAHLTGRVRRRSAGTAATGRRGAEWATASPPPVVPAAGSVGAAVASRRP